MAETAGLVLICIICPEVAIAVAVCDVIEGAANGDPVQAGLGLLSAIPGERLVAGVGKALALERGVARSTSALSSVEKGAARGEAGKLYHYTAADPANIAAEGLRPGASGRVFTTPAGDLSPLQAQIDLALPPNRGLPGHLVEIDVGTLRTMGVQVPEAGQVGRMFNMPGGGTEVVFPHAIPAEAIRVVR